MFDNKICIPHGWFHTGHKDSHSVDNLLSWLSNKYFQFSIPIVRLLTHQDNLTNVVNNIQVY